MSGIQLVMTILLMISAVVLIVSVLLQKGDAEGIAALGASTGESYFGRNKDKSTQGKLAQLTKVSAGVFVVLTLAMLFI
jgi:preprotein translocase subunit SecG